MKFYPKTEKQLADEKLIPAGTYPFEVINGEDKVSKAGNEMIEIELRVFLSDGRARMINDYLMEKLQYKLFHFCAYTGLAQKYEAGTLCGEDCTGRSGFVKIGVQTDKLGKFPDRNSVVDYVRSSDGGMKTQVEQKKEDETKPVVNDGDVPF